MAAEPPPRAWLRPKADPGRAARQWSAIEARLDARGGLFGLKALGSWRLVGGVAAAAALAAGVWIGVRKAHPTPADPIAATTTSTLLLADGSHVTLDPGARLEMQKNEPSDIATSLKDGAAEFEVVPNKERSFRVVAEGVEVRVVGTQFKVDCNDATHEVKVSVTHGVVEVRTASRPGDVRRLGAGETWSSRPVADAAPVEPTSTASASADVAPPAPPPASASTTSPDAEARALFDAANKARRAGDVARASALYRELARRFPNDPRAKVAALEIARLEMDKGDSSVAEDALRTASSAESGSSVQEDALARLVQLYASKGDQRACREARDRYLTAYPNGARATQVRAACAAR